MPKTYKIWFGLFITYQRSAKSAKELDYSTINVPIHNKQMTLMNFCRAKNETGISGTGLSCKDNTTDVAALTRMIEMLPNISSLWHLNRKASSELVQLI